MTNLYKNIFWALTTLLVLSIVFSIFVGAGESPKPLTMAQLVSKINSGDVTNIVVNGNNLEVTLKDGVKAKAMKETEAGLSETLKNLGVEERSLQSVSLEEKEAAGAGF